MDPRMDSLLASDCASEAQSSTNPVDTIGSVAIVPSNRKQPRLPRPRNRETPVDHTGSRFLQLCVELRDIPVSDTWAFVRDHKVMAEQVPGIIERFDYVEGDGGTGSVYVGNYNVALRKPGQPSFVRHRVEVRDDESHLQAIRSVGGRYSQRYNLFLSFLKVLPDAAFGDSSSMVIWRVEYQLNDPSTPIPEDSMRSHKITMELFMANHNRSKQVERPIFDREDGNVIKPWRLRGKQRQIVGPSHQLEAGASGKCRRKKSRVIKHVIHNGVETIDGVDVNIHKRTRSDINRRLGPTIVEVT